MPRRVDIGSGEAFRARPPLSSRARKALRHGPRTRGNAVRRAIARSSREDSRVVDGGVPQSRPLAEWHELSPGELITEWAGLRAWVTWLRDRYELTVEERLPRCWALHPGLVEELWVLKAWREEIYGTGQAGMGQAARYWHVELRQVTQAAASTYAAGCRTGHRGAAEIARIDKAVLAEWGGAYPLAGTPDIDIVAGQARGTSGWASSADVAAAVDVGDAVLVPGESACVHWDGAIWQAAAGGWVQVPGLGLPDGLTSGTPNGSGGPWTR
jgi:hypothetical protein